MQNANKGVYMKFILGLMSLVSVTAFADDLILLKAGATTTYPKDDWSTKNEARIRLGIEYRSMYKPENLLNGVYVLEVAYQKLPVDWAAKDFNEWNYSFKIGLCAGYEFKLCPIIGTTQHLIKGGDNWYNHWGVNAGFNVLILPKKIPWLVSGFEVTKRYSIYRQNNVSYRWNKVDMSALIGVRF
jgi:hypothetical protein